MRAGRERAGVRASRRGHVTEPRLISGEACYNSVLAEKFCLFYFRHSDKTITCCHVPKLAFVLVACGNAWQRERPSVWEDSLCHPNTERLKQNLSAEEGFKVPLN
ncbi:hypothetical protein AGIG_G4865 [Arapaima gigas]